jgi:hypothetical protein
MAKLPLTEIPEDQLKEMLKGINEHVQHSYNGIVAELDRRRHQRSEKRVFILSIIAIVVSVISLLASILVAVFK